VVAIEPALYGRLYMRRDAYLGDKLAGFCERVWRAGSVKLMDVRLTIKAINEELAKRGSGAQLERGDGYFYFSGGEVTDWLDRTVNAHSLNSLSLDQWMAEFERLKRANKDILPAPAKEPSEATQPAAKRQRTRPVIRKN
jgi:hypothetical protein